MRKLGLAIFTVVLGLTIFAACNEKETPAPAVVEQQAPAMEVAPAVVEQQAPATEVAPVPPAAK